MGRCLSPGLSASLMLLLAACGPAGQNTASSPANPDILGATESFQDFGDFVLHFNALTTDKLDAGVAAEHGVVRSPNRVLLNVSVLRNQEIGLATPVAASVQATARNLTGQLRNLPIREVREGTAIYYIGETQVANAESLIFTVDATPESTTQSLSVSFQRQFFVDQ